ncbi:flagellar assembly protein FliW [Halobacillus litoralis]|uniref:Flagellar assembly factor FliW n=1 Tax=Halobacillus litoralis TaxID=45668 RepID=A0A410MGB4_9BACI|nr:flagellar assembly protein FliW [Halobacillus litoralis]QAS53705.1 flagellar assembly protein FliW [Halobacillus litoralis]
MKVETKYFGTVEVDAEELISFPHGLPGFESFHSFVLLPVDELGTYFALQAVDEAGLSLIVTNPYIFYKDYAFDIDEQELSLEKPNDVAVYNVVTLKDPFEKSTLNLQAPIVMNVRERIAKQVILNDANYQTKHPLTQSNKGGESHARP